MQVFWRPPLTSSSQFSLKDLQAPCGLACDDASPAIIKVAGWIPGRLLEAARAPSDAAAVRCEGDGAGAYPANGREGPRDGCSEPLVFHGRGEVSWSGLLSVAPSSRLRLNGPSQFRLSCGRARQALPHAVLVVTDGADDHVFQWFEVSFRPRTKSGSKAESPSATIEVCGPRKEGINSTWQPLRQDQVCGPERWPLVGPLGDGWVTTQGTSCAAPKGWRNAPERLRPGGADVVPAMSLLVIMAAVPPETGVGSMTPNWTLLAALDEAIYRQMGPNYELRVVPIASEDQLSMLHPSRVTPLLQPATVCGVVYFLSPQRVAGDFRTKNDMVHDAPLFGLMEALEEAGLPTVWPHPSYLYRTLAGKEWPSQLCLSPQYHVPLTVRVSRQAVLTKGQRAAEEACQALCRLREAMGRPLKSAGVRAAVKVGYSWRSSGVQLCRDDVMDLSRALAKAAAAGQHASFMVQELIEGVLCEAMVYVIHGEVAGFPQYYRFPEHQAPPQYMPRKSAAQLLGGEMAQRKCEERMHSIVQQWILWAQCMSASPIPFLRIDFLLAQGKEGKEVQVWTGEVSELGVAVELQGMNSHESRDLVMHAVVTSLLKG